MAVEAGKLRVEDIPTLVDVLVRLRTARALISAPHPAALLEASQALRDIDDSLTLLTRGLVLGQSWRSEGASTEGESEGHTDAPPKPPSSNP